MKNLIFQKLSCIHLFSTLLEIHLTFEYFALHRRKFSLIFTNPICRSMYTHKYNKTSPLTDLPLSPVPSAFNLLPSTWCCLTPKFHQMCGWSVCALPKGRSWYVSTLGCGCGCIVYLLRRCQGNPEPSTADMQGFYFYRLPEHNTAI